jgi:hypothetical protein
MSLTPKYEWRIVSSVTPVSLWGLLEETRKGNVCPSLAPPVAMGTEHLSGLQRPAQRFLATQELSMKLVHLEIQLGDKSPRTQD